MKLKKYLFLLLAPLLLACETASIDASTLDGTWQLTGVFLSDALDQPCSNGVTPNNKMTLTFDTENKKVNGTSSVNLLNGSFDFSIPSQTGEIGDISFNPLGSTKIGGSEEQLQCELRYFNMLQDAREFRIEQNGKVTTLHIGTLTVNGENPRDGGTYLVFQK